MAYTDYLDDVQKIYIAYYQRPADPAGLIYWAARLDGVGGNLNEIIEAFANSAESLALYGPINSSNIGTVVDSIYNALFDRVPDAAGKAFYVDGFNAGTFTAATIMLNILNGSTGLDLLAVDNKLAAAERFTEIIDPALDGRDFQATYVGDADAIKGREYLDGVTWNPVTVPTVIEATDFIKNNIADPGDPLYTVLIGQTFMLTTGVDDVRVTTSATTDIVKGYWEDTPGTDTFSTGDSIQGNSKTILELVVDGTTWGDSPYVEMSKVDKLSVLFAKSGGFYMDASTYGTDISTITLSGKDNSNLYVYDLSATGQLDLSIAPASDSYIYASGSIDGFRISASLSNDDTDSVGAIASIGATKMSADLGEDDYAWLAYYQTTSDDAAVVSVGDMAIGAIDMNLGKSASAYFTISNWADNSGTGSATAGNITVGDINMVIGTSATAELYIYNSATTDKGNATVGNVTVGNIDVKVAAYGDQNELTIYNSAQAWNGNATAGNMTIGNISVTAADNAEEILYMYAYNYAYAYTKGNAQVGNITVGNIDIVGGDDISNGTVYLSNYAYAQKGKATAGNVTVGDVSMTVGNSGELYLTIYNEAYVATSGAATVGSITVGNVDMTVGSNATGTFYVSNYAYTAKGAATVGNVTVGDFTAYVGLDAAVTYELYNYAWGTAGATVGNTTIGNITMYGEPSADVDLHYIQVYSNKGSVGNVTIGNVDLKVDNNGSIDFSLDVTAYKDVGDVKIGDVTLTLGSNADIDTFSISVDAQNGNIASFTIGNVTINGGVGAYDSSQDFDIYADDNIGSITIGDVKVTAAKSGAFTSMTWYFEAGDDIGNINMGNTTLSAGENADNYRYVYFTAGDEIGNVTAGNVSLSAGKNGSAWLSHGYSASDDIGNIVYGGVSAIASGAGARAGFELYASANGHDIGTVNVGNVDLQAKGAGAYADAYFYFSDTGDTVGLATVGNINLYTENVKAGAANASVYFSMDSNGSITVGNVTLTAGAVTADFADTAKVNADVYLETGNNLTVGNITVVGGYSNKTPTLLDDYNNLANWLHLTETGPGSITIGNVDYSGYKAAATIDVSAWKGAGTIWAAQGATTITDNKTQNTIYLGAKADNVIMNQGMTTDKSDPTKIDAIVNFTSGADKISIDTTSGQSDFAFVTAAAANYTAFLAAANNSMFNDGYDIYARQVGGDMYVAFDKDAGGAVDFVIKLTGVSTLVASDFVIT